MNKSREIKLSISILVLGIIMFFIGIDTFTYQGGISNLYSKIGMISFISWLPILIVGIIMTIVALKRKEKKHPRTTNIEHLADNTKTEADSNNKT